MTVKELKEELNKYSDDCIVMYRHNKHGRIDVDYIDYKEEYMLSGNKIQSITFESNVED